MNSKNCTDWVTCMLSSKKRSREKVYKYNNELNLYGKVVIDNRVKTFAISERRERSVGEKFGILHHKAQNYIICIMNQLMISSITSDTRIHCFRVQWRSKMSEGKLVFCALQVCLRTYKNVF